MSELLMSRWFRRYMESLIVVWCPWVLLLEMNAVTMSGEGGGYDEDIPGRKV